MIEIPERLIEQELQWYGELVVRKTASRQVLGSLKEIGFHYQLAAEIGQTEGPLSLSDAEYSLTKVLHTPLKYRYPVVVAKELLGVPVA